MYCSACGTYNDDNNFRCTQCGHLLQTGAAAAAPAGYGYAAPPMHVPNHLVQSILVTIFCCLPLGVVAIVFAAQVNGKLAAGDVDGAWEASRKAKMFGWIAFGLGMVAIVGQIVLGVIGYLDARDRAEDARYRYEYQQYDD